MIICEDGEMVEFKTISPFYEREKDGRKCNTVRFFKRPEEMDKFVSALFSLNTIRIRNPDTRDSFERLITDVSAFSVEGLPTMFIISWQKQE